MGRPGEVTPKIDAGANFAVGDAGIAEVPPTNLAAPVAAPDMAGDFQELQQLISGQPPVVLGDPAQILQEDLALAQKFQDLILQAPAWPEALDQQQRALNSALSELAGLGQELMSADFQNLPRDAQEQAAQSQYRQDLEVRAVVLQKKVEDLQQEILQALSKNPDFQEHNQVIAVFSQALIYYTHFQSYDRADFSHQGLAKVLARELGKLMVSADTAGLQGWLKKASLAKNVLDQLSQLPDRLKKLIDEQEAQAILGLMENVAEGLKVSGEATLDKPLKDKITDAVLYFQALQTYGELEELRVYVRFAPWLEPLINQGLHELRQAMLVSHEANLGWADTIVRWQEVPGHVKVFLVQREALLQARGTLKAMWNESIAAQWDEVDDGSHDLPLSFEIFRGGKEAEGKLNKIERALQKVITDHGQNPLTSEIPNKLARVYRWEVFVGLSSNVSPVIKVLANVNSTLPEIPLQPTPEWLENVLKTMASDFAEGGAYFQGLIQAHANSEETTSAAPNPLREILWKLKTLEESIEQLHATQMSLQVPTSGGHPRHPGLEPGSMMAEIFSDPELNPALVLEELHQNLRHQYGEALVEYLIQTADSLDARLRDESDISFTRRRAGLSSLYGLREYLRHEAADLLGQAPETLDIKVLAMERQKAKAKKQDPLGHALNHLDYYISKAVGATALSLEEYDQKKQGLPPPGIKKLSLLKPDDMINAILGAAHAADWREDLLNRMPLAKLGFVNFIRQPGLILDYLEQKEDLAQELWQVRHYLDLQAAAEPDPPYRFELDDSLSLSVAQTQAIYARIEQFDFWNRWSDGYVGVQSLERSLADMGELEGSVLDGQAFVPRAYHLRRRLQEIAKLIGEGRMEEAQNLWVAFQKRRHSLAKEHDRIQASNERQEFAVTVVLILGSSFFAPGVGAVLLRGGSFLGRMALGAARVLPGATRVGSYAVRGWRAGAATSVGRAARWLTTTRHFTTPAEALSHSLAFHLLEKGGTVAFNEMGLTNRPLFNSHLSVGQNITHFVYDVVAFNPMLRTLGAADRLALRMMPAMLRNARFPTMAEHFGGYAERYIAKPGFRTFAHSTGQLAKGFATYSRDAGLWLLPYGTRLGAEYTAFNGWWGVNDVGLQSGLMLATGELENLDDVVGHLAYQLSAENLGHVAYDNAALVLGLKGGGTGARYVASKATSHTNYRARVAQADLEWRYEKLYQEFSKVRATLDTQDPLNRNPELLRRWMTLRDELRPLAS
ncbi:MAG: peptidylprolyl isomerase [Deltaproteobacteria bacterium]|nr:peptidylprolyl isomerase [Deltaproteobacteria bacterium]